MAKEKDNKKEIDEFDIFKEATRSVLQEDHKTVASGVIKESELTTGNKTMPPARAKSWQELQDAFNSYHVERFNRVMQELPDREFVRVFVKIAPFFKKNAAQQLPEGPKELTQINITINRNETVEEKIIELES